MMVLDSKFRKLLERGLGKSLEIISKENTGFKEIWKCTHEDDFFMASTLGGADDFYRNQFFF